MRNLIKTVLLAGALVAGASAGHAQDDMSSVEIRTEPVANGIYALFGRGGNIGVSTGADGVFLIDDQFAPLTDKIIAAVTALSDQPIRFVINTHWHGDHTGGNENLGDTGAIIVAHDNVRKRMSNEHFSAIFDRTTPPSPPDALPIVTFNDTVTFHLNGDTIEAFRIGPGHTDGDSIIYFHKANVVHMGDTFFNGGFPFIDITSGGSLAGLINTVKAVLARTDGDTRIIPGHGALSDHDGLEQYAAMLTRVRDEIQALIDAGNSVDETLAAKPFADLYDALGGGFMSPEVFIRIVYADLSGQPFE